jgi:predicted lipid carrier protein YhbT
MSGPLKHGLRRAVRPAGTAALVAMLDLVLWRRLPADVRDKLVGRRVEIAVTDWELSFSFTARRWGFVPRPPFAQPELRIAATAHDFGAIASGEEDSDTLYFGRRLIVEGDTELALMVKNTMDALDATRGRAFARRVHHLACRLRETAQRRARAQGI